MCFTSLQLSLTPVEIIVLLLAMLTVFLDNLCPCSCKEIWTFKDVIHSDNCHLSLRPTYAAGQRDGRLEASPAVAFVRLEVHYHPVGG